MYWKNIPSDTKIIETKYYFLTENGECIDWNGQETSDLSRNFLAAFWQTAVMRMCRLV